VFVCFSVSKIIPTQKKITNWINLHEIMEGAARPRDSNNRFGFGRYSVF